MLSRSLSSRVAIVAALAFPFGLPAAVRAQTFHEYAGGLNFVGPSPGGYSDAFYTRGFAAQASAGRQLSGLLGVRIDALVSQFALHQTVFPPTVLVPCPSAGCGGGYRVRSPMGVAGLAANGVVTVLPARFRARVYLMGGAGTYWFYRHPSREGVVRAGFSTGAGVTTPLAGRTEVFLEARYQAIINAPPGPWWVTPVTVGVKLPGLPKL